MKQTAIEWLLKEWPILKSELPHWLIEQAKEIEKEQMDKVAGDWWDEGACYVSGGERKYESFEQYYNETYRGNK
jgi:hypothetical protein